ncbi:MAG: choice-of-anchor D domain-containing protein [FCB group bacterium]|jgi:photosystem II stability/assembly factor-like uncharacterized protein
MFIKKDYIKILLFVIISLPVMNSQSYAQAWEKITTIPPPYDKGYYLYTYFLPPPNQNFGWICGLQGLTLRTTDGGNTWAGSKIPGADHMESIEFADQNTGYCSGVQGIYKSVDGGASWSSVTPLGAPSELWGSCFLNANYGVVVGGGCLNVQYFFLTTDGGANWSVYIDSIPYSGLRDVFIYGPGPIGEGYAVSSGYIWQTLDGGATWNTSATITSSDWQERLNHIGSSFLVSDAGNDCQAQGFGGGMHFSTDNGYSWTPYSTGHRMFGTFLMDDHTGWASGDNQSVYFTSDAGQHWVLRNCGIEGGNLDDIYFRDANTGWVVGDGVYRLGPDRQNVSRTNINYQVLCIPGELTDSLYIKNYSFINSTSVSLTITGNDAADYSIVFPGANFDINACDSMKIIIQFKPGAIGLKKANLHISAQPTNNQFDISLIGSATRSTSVPKDTLIIIPNTRCGVFTFDSLQWQTTNYDESIKSIVNLSGSFDISASGIFPLSITFPGIYSKFRAKPIDTGWVISRFRATILPCNVDTFITVMAYGVSPIINASPSINASLLCRDSEIYSIPVKNTGNDSLFISSLDLIDLSAGYRVIGWTNGNRVGDTILPKETDTLLVLFLPKGYGTFATSLLIGNNDSTSIRGVKNPYIISFNGTHSNTHLFGADTIIDLGVLCLGDTVKTNIHIGNSGDIRAIVSKPVYDAKVLNIDIAPWTYPLYLKSKDSIPCRLTYYTHDKPGQYFDTIILPSTPCFDSLRIIFKSNVIQSSVTLNPNIISGIAQAKSIYAKTAVATNTGTDTITISAVNIVPPATDWTFSFTPALPVSIAPGDSIIFNLNFKTDIDTTLKGNLVFRTQSKCPVNPMLALDLISRTIFLETSATALDFGYNKCLAVNFNDTITITNKGSIPDTLTKLYLTPNLPFTITNLPALPLPLDIGQSVTLIIGFNNPNEGNFNADLNIESVNLLGKPMSIPVHGEFRTVNTAPTTIVHDFGDVEICDTNRTISVEIYNKGTIADTLMINRNNKLNGFDILPSNSLPINGNDSISVSMTLIPPGFGNAGQFTEIIPLNSIVCPNIGSIKLTANIIRPRLTITPGNLDYGNIWKDDSITKYINISNRSGYKKNVDGIEIIPDSGFYKFNYNLPAALLPGDLITIPVTFTATAEGNHPAVVNIFESSVCFDTTLVPLSANVPKEAYTTTIKIGKYTVSPGDTIHVLVELLDSVPRVKPTQVDFEFSFYDKMFYPFELLYSTGSSSFSIPFTYSPGKMTGTIPQQYAVNIFQMPGPILDIKGMGFIAIPDTTTLYIDKFEPQTNKPITINKQNGFLEVTNYCTPLANFPIGLMPTVSLKLMNNIVSSELTLKATSTQTVPVNFIIQDLLGNTVLNSIINISDASNEFKIDISSLPNGIYFMTSVIPYAYPKRDKIIKIY